MKLLLNAFYIFLGANATQEINKDKITGHWELTSLQAHGAPVTEISFKTFMENPELVEDFYFLEFTEDQVSYFVLVPSESQGNRVFRIDLPYVWRGDVLEAICPDGIFCIDTRFNVSELTDQSLRYSVDSGFVSLRKVSEEFFKSSVNLFLGFEPES